MLGLGQALFMFRFGLGQALARFRLGLGQGLCLVYVFEGYVKVRFRFGSDWASADVRPRVGLGWV